MDMCHDLHPIEYLGHQNRLKELEILASNFFEKYDALVSPTTIMRAMKVEDSEIDGPLHDRSLLSSANTQPQTCLIYVESTILFKGFVLISIHQPVYQ